MECRGKEALGSEPTLAPDAMRQDSGEGVTRHVFLEEVGLELTLEGFLKRKRKTVGEQERGQHKDSARCFWS